MNLEEQALEYLKDNPKYRNKKKGSIYIYLGECINCTNAQDGQTMIMYSKDDMIFVREKEEFFQKFEKAGND